MQRLTRAQIKTTREDFSLKQANICPLCNQVLYDPCLDHSHQTGSVRAVLHRQCNAFEGRIHNNSIRHGIIDLPAFLRNLADYYDKHSTEPTGLLHPTHLTPEEKILRRNKKARKRYKLNKEQK